VKLLAQVDSPVAALDTRVEPRILVRDGFKIALWRYYESIQSPLIPPAEYARTLEHLHAGLRQIKFSTPRAMARVAAVQQDVASRDVTPDLTDTDREFLVTILRDLRCSIVNRHAFEQPLHGEPHSGNVLSTNTGPLFIDFENTSYGPVEYDLGWVPREVSLRYSGADQELVDQCRGLVLAMVAAYRWRRDDQHPSGRESAMAFLNVLRDGPPYRALEYVTW
jgi:aminoglycoside phosphotransferase (APT) family kinase protein